MHTRKRRGSNIEPWGTPAVTSFVFTSVQNHSVFSGCQEVLQDQQQLTRNFIPPDFEYQNFLQKIVCKNMILKGLLRTNLLTGVSTHA